MHECRPQRGRPRPQSRPQSDRMTRVLSGGEDVKLQDITDGYRGCRESHGVYGRIMSTMYGYNANMPGWRNPGFHQKGSEPSSITYSWLCDDASSKTAGVVMMTMMMMTNVMMRRKMMTMMMTMTKTTATADGRIFEQRLSERWSRWCQEMLGVYSQRECPVWSHVRAVFFFHIHTGFLLFHYQQKGVCWKIGSRQGMIWTNFLCFNSLESYPSQLESSGGDVKWRDGRHRASHPCYLAKFGVNSQRREGWIKMD